MTKDEALKMAIEAMTKADNYFEQLCSLLITFGVSPSELNMHKDTFLIKPINACKEALQTNALDEMQKVTEKEYYQQPAQEPVAWMHIYDGEVTEFNDFKACDECEPLYTHPHQWQGNKEFVGLTDDEIAKSIVTRGVPNCDWNEVTIDYLKEDIVAIARAIEQELKTKNGFSGLKDKNT